MREKETAGAEATGAESPAFAARYEQYAARVFTYCQYRCADAQTAEDLTAQVFEQAWRCLPRYDEQRAPFAAWLFSIARHVVTDWQRRRYLRTLLSWEEIFRQPSGEPGPEQTTVEREERIRLRRALEQLSGRERDLLGLHFAGDLPYREIAGLTGLSESNVAVIIFRALGKLRRQMVDAEPRALRGGTHAEVKYE